MTDTISSSCKPVGESVTMSVPLRRLCWQDLPIIVLVIHAADQRRHEISLTMFRCFENGEFFRNGGCLSSFDLQFSCHTSGTLIVLSTLFLVQLPVYLLALVFILQSFDVLVFSYLAPVPTVLSVLGFLIYFSYCVCCLLLFLYYFSLSYNEILVI